MKYFDRFIVWILSKITGDDPVDINYILDYCQLESKDEISLYVTIDFACWYLNEHAYMERTFGFEPLPVAYKYLPFKEKLRRNKELKTATEAIKGLASAFSAAALSAREVTKAFETYGKTFPANFGADQLDASPLPQEKLTKWYEQYFPEEDKKESYLDAVAWGMIFGGFFIIIWILAFLTFS